MTVTVVGVGSADALTDAARAAVDGATLLIGSRENLAAVDAPASAERFELGPLAPALVRLAWADDAVVLASGDPGFFGILRVLRQAGYDCAVLPAVSSVAVAAARAGLSWDDAVVVSAHGRELRAALNACRAFGSVAVLTGPGAGPVELARGLAGWPRELVVASEFGRAHESVVRLPADEVARRDPADFAASTVVFALAAERPSTMRWDNQPAAAPAAGWALPESAYRHRDSMITKAEVRAYVLARLRPSLGRLVWDIGAGSGSVGIECNRLGAAVVAVERDADAGELITANAAAHGARVRVVTSAAPSAFDGLPEPDAAFVGGGGLPAVRGVLERAVPTVVAAFAALDRALAAHAAFVDAGYRVEGVQLSAARLADLPGGSLRLAAENPVLVLTGERT